MRDFFNTYGLWAVFFLALLENDVAFIAIGVVWQLGSDHPLTPGLNIFTAVPAAILAALLHDSAWFLLGWQKSAAIKASRVYRRIGPMIERFAERFGPWEIFLARFIFGTRNSTSVFWGIQKLPYPEFAGLEVLALTVWGSLLVTVGYLVTGGVLKLIGHVENQEHPYLLLTALVVAFGGMGLMRYVNRRGIAKIQKKVEARARAAGDPDAAEDREMR